MNIDNLPILTKIEDGQPYVDEPVYTKPKKMRNAIRSVFKLPLWPDILVAYNHVKLRWMKPDGNGGLVPR